MQCYDYAMVIFDEAYNSCQQSKDITILGSEPVTWTSARLSSL